MVQVFPDLLRYVSSSAPATEKILSLRIGKFFLQGEEIAERSEWT